MSRIKDIVHLLQRMALSFDEEKVDPGRLDNVPEDIDYVDPPTDPLQSNRCRISVYKFC